MRKRRKHYKAGEKVVILCDELGLQPTVFYRQQKEFFENGASAFEQKAGQPAQPTDAWKTLTGVWVRHDTLLPESHFRFADDLLEICKFPVTKVFGDVGKR